MIPRADLKEGHWYASAKGQVRKLSKMYDKHIIYYRPYTEKVERCTIRAFRHWCAEDLGIEPKDTK